MFSITGIINILTNFGIGAQTLPQLDGTRNASDSSDIDSHDYLDLVNIEIIQPNTRGQKKKQKAAEAEIANIHLAEVEIIKPNTRGRKLRQKVPAMKLLI